MLGIFKKNKSVNQGKKEPVSNNNIFRVMFIVAIALSLVFLVKNLLAKEWVSSILIGASVTVFAVVFITMQLLKAKENVKEYAICIFLVLLVFVIGVNSGGYYSDDFVMFLAVIAFSGMYLEPKISCIQLVMGTIFLGLMYVLHPEKADPLGQYLQCLGEFFLSGLFLIFAINRGRAFINISDDRAKEAEKLVGSIKEMGVDLDVSFTESSQRINDNTNDLKSGSASIVENVNTMQLSCDDVQNCIGLSQQSIQDLNDEVGRFEQALKENQANMAQMEAQLALVSKTIEEANSVFQLMEKKMGEVADVAEQLGDISFNTSILSLNASIEAARAGTSGAGFEVVATEMRQLSNNSNIFSEQVSEVVKELMSEVSETAKQFEDSTEALEASKKSMAELEDSFDRLTKQFDSLYQNIGTQTANVGEVGIIFNDLQSRVIGMQQYSAHNQKAVEAIVDAMEIYRVNISKVIENTRVME